MAAGITEIFAYGRTGKRSIILKGCRISCRSRNHDRIIQRSFLLQSVYYRSHCRTFLSYGYINTIHRFASKICFSLVYDRIYRNRCLTCLTVTDDELTLSATDWNHGIYRLQTCLKRLCNRLTEDDSRSLSFQRHLAKFASNASFAVKRLAQRVHHAADHRFADIDRSDSSRTAYAHSFLDPVGRAQKDSTDIVLLKVHHHRLDIIVKLQKLACLGIQKSLDPDYSVTHLQHLTDLLKLKVGIYLPELTEQHIRYLRRSNCICHIRLFY